MVKCEQFLYTSAQTEKKKGYQIIAKSAGVSDDTISSLEGYLYPLGGNLNELKEARSLLILGKTKAAYSILKIGIGYDGRMGTIYNHTFVISISDFEKIGFDSRIFESYFVKDDNIRGELKPIQIEPKKIPPNFDILKKLDVGTLGELLHRLLTKSKIALVKTDEVFLLQNLLAVMPPYLRLVSFSTMVSDPQRQPQYEIIQVPEQSTPRVDKNFVIIDPKEKPTLSIRDNTMMQSVQTLVDIIMRKDERKLITIHKDYETISEQLSIIQPIKIKEIFDKTELEKLAMENNFSSMKSNVQLLYSSNNFNQASPTVMVSITHKIRKIIQKSLKRLKRLEKKGIDVKRDDIVTIIKILLDSMNYLQRYSEKKKNAIIENKILDEKITLDEILFEVSKDQPQITPYVFDIHEYWRGIYQQAWDLGLAFTLRLLGRR